MTFVVLDTDDLTQEMVDVCLQSAMLTVRQSCDDSLSLLSYTGETPAVLVGVGTTYDFIGITAVLATAAWTVEGP